MRRIVALLLILTLTAVSATGFAKGLPLQDCHRVELTYTDTTQRNYSVVRLWTADTVLDSVDEELASITAGYVASMAVNLPKAENATSQNSRLDVSIRYSRTGTTWMSFVIQARTTYHRELTGQQLTTRTYDMVTGERILLTDIFPEDSFAWMMIGSEVYDQVSAYWPEETPSERKLQKLTSRESLEQMEFSLQGMSLVLYIPASQIYPGHNTMLRVVLYYPQIRPFMTAEAQAQTDNDTLYNVVALTFDDGPDRTNTTLVLNNLMTEGVVATFFVVGNRIEEYEDLVQREFDEGHGVGSHNWTHGNVSKMTGERLHQIPVLVNEAMIHAVGLPAPYDRVPYGLYPRMINARVGMAYIQWSLDTYDWRGLSASVILGKVRSQATDGDIILCHDIKDNTPGAIPGMVRWLQENGFMLLTIDELFAKDGIVLEPNHVYFRNRDGVVTRKQ